MSVKFEEIMKKMKEAGETGSSKLNMRSEALQEKPKAARFSMLKKDKKKKSKILIVKELAIPFNPATGEEDAQFNPRTKWRPPYSATSVMLLVKGMVNENEDAKAAFMDRAGVDVWDTTDLENVTEQDKAVLGKYLTPRIFTIPQVNVNIPTIAGNNKFGKNYTLSVETDPITGEYTGEIPLILQAHKFFIETAYEELDEYNKQIEAQIVKHDESQQKEHKSAIFNKVPISDLKPANFVQIIEIPLDSQYGLAKEDELRSATADSISSNVCLARLNVALNDAINKFKSGELGRFDKYIDFYAFDMSCPNDTDDPAEIGRRTVFEKEVDALADLAYFPSLNVAMMEYLDNEQKLEEKVYRSAFVTKYDESAENRLAIALKDVIDLDNKYVTQKVLEANANFISLVCGDEGAQELIASEIGTSTKAEGNLDSKAAKVEAKKFDLSGDIETEDLDLDAMLNM